MTLTLLILLENDVSQDMMRSSKPAENGLICRS